MKITKEKALGIALLIQLLLYCVQSLLLTLCFSGAGQSVTLLFSCLTALAVFGLPLLAYGKLASVRAHDILRVKNTRDRTRNPSKTVIMLVFGIAMTVTAVNVIGMLTELVFGLFGKSTGSAVVSDPLTLALLLVRNVVIASVMEELLFRGAVMSAFSERGRSFAVIGSALLFALMHYNLGQFFYAFAAGIVIAVIATFTGSVATAIAVHLAQNFISFAFSVLSLLLPKEAYTAVSDAAFVFFLAVAAIGAIYFVRKKSAPEATVDPVTAEKEKKATLKPVTAEKGRAPAAELVLYAVLALLLTVLNF